MTEPPEAEPSANGPLVVEAEAVTRTFGPVVALAGVSLNVRRGEVFALIGPNGAGKSTLMKILTTMQPMTSGAARVAGFDVARQAQDVRRRIGYVPQLLSADGDLTGFENMMLSARLYLIPAEQRRRMIHEALERMGLHDAAGRLVRTYSGGMARRLEIAQSTLHRPDVLFMDDPTVGLDPDGRKAVWANVAALQRETGAAVIFSTHYMDEAEDVCDRLAVIARGRLAAVGAPAELRARIGAGATLDDVFTTLTEEVQA